jgi:Tol biopolymer transport system component
VDVQTQQSQLILGSEQDPMDYSMPDWSPDGSWLAVALRSLTGSPSKQVWIMHPDGSQRQSVTSEQLFTHAAYHWSPDSQMLAFQRLELGASATRPQIAVWNRADGSITLLAEDAFQPAWLP